MRWKNCVGRRRSDRTNPVGYHASRQLIEWEHETKRTAFRVELPLRVWSRQRCAPGQLAVAVCQLRVVGLEFADGHRRIRFKVGEVEDGAGPLGGRGRSVGSYDDGVDRQALQLCGGPAGWRVGRPGGSEEQPQLNGSTSSRWRG